MMLHLLRAVRFAAIVCLAAFVAVANAEKSTAIEAVVKSATKLRAPGAAQVQLSCAENWKPDLVVVSGAISARSVRPKDAAEQIDKQLAAIRAFVQGRGGKLNELERLRAARNPEPERSERRDNDKMPFLQVQKIEAEFPTSVDIDDALERLFKLGLDQYGKDIRVDSYDRSREFRSLTTYRIKGLPERLTQLLEACARADSQKLCGEASVKQCMANLQWTNVHAKTSVIETPSGGRSAQTLAIPGRSESYYGDSERFETLGANAIRFTLSGYVTLPAPLQ
jgi:hypothetical protein